ncbi:protein of unknown function [Caballeronia sp. S22]
MRSETVFVQTNRIVLLNVHDSFRDSTPLTVKKLEASRPMAREASTTRYDVARNRL